MTSPVYVDCVFGYLDVASDAQADEIGVTNWEVFVLLALDVVGGSMGSALKQSLQDLDVKSFDEFDDFFYFGFSEAEPPIVVLDCL